MASHSEMCGAEQIVPAANGKMSKIILFLFVSLFAIQYGLSVPTNAVKKEFSVEANVREFQLPLAPNTMLLNMKPFSCQDFRITTASFYFDNMVHFNSRPDPMVVFAYEFVNTSSKRRIGVVAVLLLDKQGKTLSEDDH